MKDIHHVSLKMFSETEIEGPLWKQNTHTKKRSNIFSFFFSQDATALMQSIDIRRLINQYIYLLNASSVVKDITPYLTWQLKNQKHANISFTVFDQNTLSIHLLGSKLILILHFRYFRYFILIFIQRALNAECFNDTSSSVHKLNLHFVFFLIIGFILKAKVGQKATGT